MSGIHVNPGNSRIFCRWLNVFATSRALLRKFQVEVTGRNIEQVVIPNVPIRNLTLRKISIESDAMNFTNTTSHLRAFADEIQVIVDQFKDNSERKNSLSDDDDESDDEDDDEEEEIWTVYETISFRMKNRPPPVNLALLIEFLGNFSDSIENLTLEEVNFNNSDEFYALLGSLKSLKNLEVFKCELYNFNENSCEFLGNPGNFQSFCDDLKAVSIFKSNKNFEKVFKVFQSVKNFEIIDEMSMI